MSDKINNNPPDKTDKKKKQKEPNVVKPSRIEVKVSKQKFYKAIVRKIPLFLSES